MTNVEKVRLRIGDTAGAVFTEAEIQSFLDDNSDSVLSAAADALEAMAASSALLAKREKSENFEVDRTRVAAELRASAAALRAQDESAPYSGEHFDDVYPWDPTAVSDGDE